MNAVQGYRRAVGKALHCGVLLKRNILRQLDDMLSPLLEENPAPTRAELTQALGEPRRLAETLLHEQPDEVLSHDRRQRIFHWAAALVLVCMVVGFAVYYLTPREINLTVKETIVIEEEVVQDE